jgi:hypothetical protein
MRLFRIQRPCGLLALAALGFTLIGADKADDPKIELRVAKYDEMGKVVRDLKGKIVVVDFWQDT